MVSLLILVGMIVLAIPASIAFLLIGQSRLRKRVEQLEAQLLHKSAGDETDDVTSSPTVDAQVTTTGPWAPPLASKPSSESLDAEGNVDVPKEPAAAIVLTSDRFAALGVWFRENWFYAVSAVSLALAGIFLVQYGAEKGLLPPIARVIAALIFGAVLIFGGEIIRRRFGDDETTPTAFLPSVFSGAGLVTLFGGILAARQLYDLIGAEEALAAMVVITLLGLVLGWFHGPLLAAVGLIGAFSAPFVVGGESDDPSWLYVYFVVIAQLGMGIDAVRRWAWISVLTLVGAYSTSYLLMMSAPLTEGAYLICVTALALIAIVVPVRTLWPDHSGTMITEMIWRRKEGSWPEFPTRVAFASVALSSVLLSIHLPDTDGEFWISFFLLAGLTLGLIAWAKDARALEDVTIPPALGLVWVVLIQGFDGGVVWRRFWDTYVDAPEADFPYVITGIVGLGALVSVCAAWRSFRSGRYQVAWAGVAAIYAPVLAIALEIGWFPSEVIGAYPWALHAVALSVLMVVLAERFARVDRDDRLRASLVTLSALSCLSFACVIVLSSAALTVALTVMIVVAAALDRQFSLPAMGWFIWVGVGTVGARLVVSPGLEWAILAPVLEMTFVYSTALLGFLAALVLLRPLRRPIAALMLESAAWSTGGILLSLLLLRWLQGNGDGGAQSSHWGFGLSSVIWLLLAFAQVQRLDLGGRLNAVRYTLATLFAGLGLFLLFQAVLVVNPVLDPTADPVLGPPILNTLAVAYLLPAIIIVAAALRIGSIPLRLKQLSFGIAGMLGAIWLGLAIRHLWQGAAGMYEGYGVTQPELYTYTITLLVIGGALFYQSLARQSGLMRKAGLAVIGLAVAKVFLIDIAGLGGLIRVFSLLALGLALAGLAWLNRWAKLRHSSQGPEPLDH